jgi:hypothetical protein
MTDKLKSCPFCGDPMILEAKNFGHTSAYQDTLPEGQRCILRHTAYPEEMIAAWNTRNGDHDDR